MNEWMNVGGWVFFTCPTSISFWYLRAAAPEEVKMAVPLP